MLAIKVTFRCPKCNISVTYDLTEEDWEKIKLSGICDVAFDHGDHILLLFIDRNGNVRDWKIYNKKGIIKPVGELGVWHRTSINKYRIKNVDFMVANIRTKAFSDAFWNLNTDLMLKFLEASDNIVFVVVSGNSVLVYPIDELRYAISKISQNELSSIARFLNIITEKFKNNIVESLEFQKIIVSALAFRKKQLMLDYAIELLHDINKYSVIEVNKRTFSFLVADRNMFRNIVNEKIMNLLQNISDRIKIRDMIDKMSLDELSDFILSYYKLKKLKILEVM